MSRSQRGYSALERDEWELGQYDSEVDDGLFPEGKARKGNWRTHIVMGILILSNIGTLVMLVQTTEGARPELGQSGMLFPLMILECTCRLTSNWPSRK